MNRQQESPRLQARIAGGLYVIIIATGLFAELFVREALTVSGDAAATARNILASEPLWRLGTSAELVEEACCIALALLFYYLFKPVSRSLVLIAVFFALVSITIVIVDVVLQVAPTLLLGGAHYLTAFAPSQLQALALLALRLHDGGFNTSLAFFGVHCVLIGYVIFRSTFLPRIIGVLYAIAGLCYVINSSALFLSPSFAAHLDPYILIPSFIGELSLCLWLLVAGVNVSKWEETARVGRVV
jgi:Domain of unknown function (DUF4386)